MTRLLGWSSALVLSAGIAQAQETSVEQLKQELKQATEKFERALEEQKRVIDDLNTRLERLQAIPSNAPASPPREDSPAATNSRLRGPLSAQRGNVFMDVGLIGTFAAGTSTASDIEGGTQLGGHDPNQRGFTLQGVEASFNGAIDPYFLGQANVLFSLDSHGESYLELEEAFLETVSLPWNLQLRAGHYFTEFGRHNPTHPHSWTFVDAPLVNSRFLGPDGLRNPGARLSYLFPTPFYSEFLLGIQNSHGETAAPFRSEGHHHGEEDEEQLPFTFRHADNDRGLKHFGDLLFAPRYAVSFDVSESQTLLFGASGAFGPNSSGGEDAGTTDTQVYGLDLTWKWKPATHAGGFPFVSFQTEAMLRRYEAGAFDWDENGNGLVDDGELAVDGAPASLPGETLVDYGFYSQLLYGFRKGWVAGLRFDYLAGNDADYEDLDFTLDSEPVSDISRATRWRISPNLTWYPSEFSKVRLQYNYDDRDEVGEDHSVWLQFEFILGAHAAHKF